MASRPKGENRHGKNFQFTRRFTGRQPVALSPGNPQISHARRRGRIHARQSLA
ncbi:hypothetical protein NYP16_03400 [Alphaproteobacteria bacterium LMG 31809]|uniref:Uncharacterized protein n=1 Tax=Govanella unica TaxID=2975056 RepID=A0A9X3TWF4_9PROT|nr:hypothetical protein [Govania unica]